MAACELCQQSIQFGELRVQHDKIVGTRILELLARLGLVIDQRKQPILLGLRENLLTKQFSELGIVAKGHSVKHDSERLQGSNDVVEVA